MLVVDYQIHWSAGKAKYKVQKSPSRQATGQNQNKRGKKERRKKGCALPFPQPRSNGMPAPAMFQRMISSLIICTITVEGSDSCRKMRLFRSHHTSQAIRWIKESVPFFFPQGACKWHLFIHSLMSVALLQEAGFSDWIFVRVAIESQIMLVQGLLWWLKSRTGSIDTGST